MKRAECPHCEGQGETTEGDCVVCVGVFGTRGEVPNIYNNSLVHSAHLQRRIDEYEARDRRTWMSLQLAALIVASCAVGVIVWHNLGTPL